MGKKLYRKSKPSDNSISKEKFRSSPEWQQFRLEMLDDRKGICDLCGIDHSRNKPKLNVHHKDLKKENYQHIEDSTRFSLLCFNCHKIVHQLQIRVKSKKQPCLDEDVVRIVKRFFI